MTLGPPWSLLSSSRYGGSAHDKPAHHAEGEYAARPLYHALPRVLTARSMLSPHVIEHRTAQIGPHRTLILFSTLSTHSVATVKNSSLPT